MSEIKVLICDDSLLIRKKLKQLLEICHIYNVEEAIDGLDALEKVSSFNPDLVFLDIVMPKKDGIETLMDIQKINTNVKVIMASSVGTQSNLKKALENGAYDFIQKPITLENLTPIIEKIIKDGN